MGATVLTTERSPPEEGSVVAVIIKGVKNGSLNQIWLNGVFKKPE